MKDYIAHLKFDTLSEEEIISFYETKVKKHEMCITVTPNLDIMRVTYKNKQLRDFINTADIATIDGVPIKWIARWCHKKNFKYKISGSDFSLKIVEFCSENNLKLLLVGGKEGVADKAKENLLTKYPSIEIETICPPFGHEKDPKLTAELIEEINSKKADIVFMCTGFPKADLFFVNNRESFPKAMYFFLGATVDFLAGSVKRAPKWMSKCGLEWLYRLFHDFRRLFKRYWLDFWFLFKIFFICIFNRKKFESLR